MRISYAWLLVMMGMVMTAIEKMLILMMTIVLMRLLQATWTRMMLRSRMIM